MHHPHRPTRRALLLAACAAPLTGVAAAPAPAAEVHPTHVARTFTLVYQMQRGGLRGSSEFGWKRSGDSYEAHMKGKVAGFPVLDWASSGGFDSAGVAPQRYLERRIGKADRDAVFKKSEARISFSGGKDDVAFVAGAQDRLSWMIQLPAILAADPAKAKVGTRIAMFVVGTRGHADTWIFESLGNETVRTPSGSVRAVKWSRKVSGADAEQSELWVDPEHDFLPVKLRLPLPPLDEPLEFNLVDASW